MSKGFSKFSVHTCFMLLTVGLLPACEGGSVKETLGMNRRAPDEFRVVTRPPLTVPPQFTLAPPSLDALPPAQLPTTDQAKELVLGSEPSQEVTLLRRQSPSANGAARVTSADSQFLQNVGASQANPEIRRQLTEERLTKQIVEEEESWWDILSTEPEPKDPMVNAQQEAERIGANEDAGKPVTEGETPVVKPRDMGILGRIMGD